MTTKKTKTSNRELFKQLQIYTARKISVIISYCYSKLGKSKDMIG